MKKKIIVSVISDVVTDQRVQKECNTLHMLGYEVLVLGRKSANSFLLKELPYKVIRFKNLFRRDPLMYLVFNTQLFFYLLFSKAHIVWANDLDTLLPNFLISRLKQTKLIYDSHEYFTASVYKKHSRDVWERLEKFLFPKLKNVITVNDSIKQVYEKKYNVPITVLRNVPYKLKPSIEKIKLSNDKKILVMQGIGLNENRGAEEALLSMQFLPGDFNLYFIGSGTVINKLKTMVRNLSLSSKVTFIDTMPYQQMMEYTTQCFLGLIFEKIQFSDQHLFALPNKFFDYIQAGIPILSSHAVEIERLIKQYEVGDFIDRFEPAEIAEKILEISKDTCQYAAWKKNTIEAAQVLNWENEKGVLIEFMKHLK